ncbi:MAG: MBL fold metallo-hydrolase, partial [Bacilli bacterium]
MKVTILGCQSPYPGAGGATPGYLLQTDQGSILIDCGSGVFAQLEKHLHFNELDAVIYSHLHHDHMADHLILQYAVFIAMIRGERKQLMMVYAPNQPKEMADRLPYSNGFNVRTIDDRTELDICGVHIAFLRTDHGIPCYAMKITNGGK